MPIYKLDDVSPEFPSGNEYWIAPDAVLIGRVRLARDASIWFGAVLRGDNDWITIGQRSNIQDNAVIHTDFDQPTVVGDDVTVGHNVILHSCHVGDNSLIGMGSTILNGARIGRNCLIGANTLIPEGREIPDGVLVLGSPGKIVRELKQEERDNLLKIARGYIERGERYRKDLRALPLPPSAD